MPNKSVREIDELIRDFIEAVKKTPMIMLIDYEVGEQFKVALRQAIKGEVNKLSNYIPAGTPIKIYIELSEVHTALDKAFGIKPGATPLRIKEGENES